MRNSQRRFEVRRQRTRSGIKKLSDRPRLSVHKSGRHIYAQIIDGQNTIVSCSTLEKDFYQEKKSCKNKNFAEKIGDEIGIRAKAKGVTKVVFDKGGYKYHGILKSLADSARKHLEF